MWCDQGRKAKQGFLDLFNDLPFEPNDTFNECAAGEGLATLGMSGDFTFDDLKRLVEIFGSKLINISPGSPGYYGDYERAEVVIEGLDPDWVEAQYESIESRDRRVAEHERDEKCRNVEKLMREAAQSGFELVPK